MQRLTRKQAFKCALVAAQMKAKDFAESRGISFTQLDRIIAGEHPASPINADIDQLIRENPVDTTRFFDAA